MNLMATLQNKYLKAIEQDKNAVISRVVELSEMTYPLLISRFHYLRKLNNVHNKIDVRNEEAQNIQEYNYVCEHNLLFFLTITGQFDLIRELFEHNEKLAAIRQILKEIEREHKEAQQHGYQLIELANQETLKRNQAAANTNLPKTAITSENSLNALMMYQYYDALYKDLTYKHHVAQTAIYEEAYTNRMARMNEVCKSILNNSSVNSADKKMLLDMRLEYHKERDRIMSIPITNQDGSYNLKAAADRRKQIEELDNKISTKFSNYLGDLCANSKIDRALKNTLQEKLNEEHADTTLYKTKIVKGEQQYQEHIKDVLIHRQQNQKDSAILIDKLIQDIKSVPIQQLSNEQRLEYNQTMAQLIQLNRQLKQVDSPTQQNELFIECFKKLDTLKQIVQPFMSNEIKKEFKQDLDKLHQVITPPENTYQQTHSATAQEKVTLSNKENYSSLQATSPVKEKSNADLPFSFFANQSESSVKNAAPINAQSVFIPPSSIENIENQRKIKLLLQETKACVSPLEEMAKIVKDTIAETEQSMLLEEFSEEDIQDYERLCTCEKELGQQAELSEHTELLISEMKRIVQKLHENHESLADLKNQFDEVTEKILPCKTSEKQQSLRC